MDLSYPPGYPPLQPGPLARFLPPLEEGSVPRILDKYGNIGDLVFDPFGTSPRLVVEAAKSGRAVLVAANNPITRFILQYTIKPFTLAQLQAALARLAAVSKNGDRLERFLLDLYRTDCTRCGAQVIADSFIWDRDAERPILKLYVCERCNFAGEGPATEEDGKRAREHTRRGLQRALALEQVAPAGDPDRQYADAALAVYPGRTLYALNTLVNKLEQLGLEQPLKAAAQALLLSAFGTVNALWGYPEGRERPRQLRSSPRHREDNVWRALERAVGVWALEDPGLQLITWPSNELPEPGMVAIFPGPVRELLPTLPAGATRFILTALPRPNQAYWTLSTLWTAWLWGRNATAPIKVALRRRRYGWAWHAGALHTVMVGLAPVLESDSLILVLIPEVEPGFLAAALAGFDSAGFNLTGRALHLDEGQAFLTWSSGAKDPSPLPIDIQHAMAEAAVGVLQARGEPAPYPWLHAAAWCEMARMRQLALLWEAEEEHLLTKLGDTFESVLRDRKLFTRLGRGIEIESGLYWLVDLAGVNPPLADRVESIVLGALRLRGELTRIEVDEHVHAELPGLLTPDRRLVRACLLSYATEDPQEGVWRLRSEDESEARAADCLEIQRLLVKLGRRLKFDVNEDAHLVWLDEQGETIYAFCVLETAELGSALEDSADPITFVLPGGRASLVAEKAHRDPRIRDLLQNSVGVIKFRHVRRLAVEIGVNRANLAERMAIDPPEHHDPQLPLL